MSDLFPVDAQPEAPSSLTLPISPLIRGTLLLLYGALTLPLPFLAAMAQSPVSPRWLTVGLVLGGLGLYAALTERVVVTEAGIGVTYPHWVTPIWRRGWWLTWSEVQALKPRSTGQGGIVYYLVTHSGEARLLPMRVAGFARLVRYIQAQTNIDTRDVRPLAQPWMYFILLGLTILLLLVDAWTLWTLSTLGGAGL